MKTWIISLLAFTSLVFVAFLPVSAVNYCPPLWTHYQLPKQTYCYRYFGWKAPWAMAEATCKNFTICDGKETAHLVSVESMEEEDFIAQYWQAMVGPFQGEKDVWIGYSRDSPKSDWKWTMPTKTNHQNWLPNKTPSKEESGCVQQRSSIYGRPYWSIAPCENWHPFMCKMRAM